MRPFDGRPQALDGISISQEAVVRDAVVRPDGDEGDSQWAVLRPAGPPQVEERGGFVSFQERRRCPRNLAQSLSWSTCQAAATASDVT